MLATSRGVMKKESPISMKRSIHPNISQVQFDFDSLAILPVPDNAEIGLIITPLPEPEQEQEYWWSNLEYRDIPRKPGIYAIVNTINGHFYIGSAVSLYRRKYDHFGSLKANRHKNAHLQNAYNCYGTKNFRFCIIECVTNKKDLIEREQHYIDTMNPEYNINPNASSQLGMKRSEKSKAKMSEAKKGESNSNYGKPMSEEQKISISEALKGHEISDRTRTKISESLKDKPLAPESIAKREATKKARREAGEYAPVISPLKGKPLSPASIAKRTATRKAKREADPTYCKSTHNRGKTFSEKARKNMSEAHKGKKLSPASIEKREATSNS